MFTCLSLVSCAQTKKLLPSLVLLTIVQLVSAAGFVLAEPNMTYSDALYHCFVTVATVGYGDVKIETRVGRLWACVHILIGVVLRRGVCARARHAVHELCTMRLGHVTRGK